VHLSNDFNEGERSDYAWAANLHTIPGAVPLTGNWDATGGDSFGYYDPNDGTVHLRNPLSAGASSVAWDTDLENIPDAVPLTGDWDKNGQDSFGYYDPNDGTFHLRNPLGPGSSSYAWDTDLETTAPNAIPLAGDWDASGADSVGWYNPDDGSFHLRNALNAGESNYVWDTDLNTAVPNAIIMVGDWDGNGRDTWGYYNPNDGTFHLRNAFGSGPSDYAWPANLHTVRGAVPLTGNWDGR
jgi:hypothetical protein